MGVLVGLTGGIATGKSSVLSMLAKRGAATISADDIVHELLEADDEVRRLVVEEFGPPVLSADGAIDRKGLGRVVFSDPVGRKKLESILHPRVMRRIREWAGTAARNGVAVAEVPLLFEAGLSGDFDRTVTVCAEHTVQVARLFNRGLSRESAEARIAAQMPVMEKARLSDYVIHNNGSLEDLEAEVQRLWTEFADARET